MMMNITNVNEAKVENCYLKISLSSSIAKGQGIQFFNALGSYARQHDAHKIMIDARGLECRHSYATQYLFANDVLPTLDFERNLQVGVWVDEITQQYEFFELTFNNAGYRFKAFSQVDELEEWLA